MEQTHESETKPANNKTSKRLVRRSDEAWISGVAAGLGAHFNLDPNIFRAMFLLLSFVGGIGVILYLAATMLVPNAMAVEEVATPIVHTIDLGPFTRKEFYRGWGLPIAFALGLIIFIQTVHTYRFDNGGIIFPLIIICVGGYLLSDRPSRARNDAQMHEPASVSENTETAPQVTNNIKLAEKAREDRKRLARENKERRKQARVLRTATIGCVFLLVGVLVLLDRANVINVSFKQVMSGILIVLGIGLLTGTWFGRARGLIFLGLLLLPFVIVANLIDVPLGGGSGSRDFHPHELAQPTTYYRLGAGKLYVDLHDVVIPAGEKRAITVTVGGGLAEIIVPDNARIEVYGTAGGGVLELLDARNNGTHISESIVRGDGTQGTLSITVGVGFGKAIVERHADETRNVVVIKPSRNVEPVSGPEPTAPSESTTPPVPTGGN